MSDHHSDAEIVRRSNKRAVLEQLLRVDEHFLLVRCALPQARGGRV
jgi:hypothetical protein